MTPRSVNSVLVQRLAATKSIRALTPVNRVIAVQQELQKRGEPASLAAIAGILRVPQSTVFRHKKLLRAGVPIRKRGRPSIVSDDVLVEVAAQCQELGSNPQHFSASRLKQRHQVTSLLAQQSANDRDEVTAPSLSHSTVLRLIDRAEKAGFQLRGKPQEAALSASPTEKAQCRKGGRVKLPSASIAGADISFAQQVRSIAVKEEKRKITKASCKPAKRT